MKHERNALAARAFPLLEQLCRLQGFQFQAIDLRWGVSPEAALDHRTMRICFDELRRSQHMSPRPNFLVLLGDRYGWRPLPEEISVDEFNALANAAITLPPFGDRLAPAILQQWYREDSNSIPPAYLLQSRRQHLDDGRDCTQDEAWNPVQAVLWKIINRAMPAAQLPQRFDLETANDLPPAIVRFQASATEQEIWYGALRVPGAGDHVLAFCREIADFAALSGPQPGVARTQSVLNQANVSEFVDPATHAAQVLLKSETKTRSDTSHVLPTLFRGSIWERNPWLAAG